MTLSLPAPLRGLALACAALFAVPAAATGNFPETIRSHLGLAARPPQSCGLCHANGVTGTGTVTTPFGKAILARGVSAGDIVTLGEALDGLEASATDSDGDGTPDVAELRAATDPNAAASGTPPQDDEGPRFGCGASAVPANAAPLGFAGLLGLAWLLSPGRPRGRRRAA